MNANASSESEKRMNTYLDVKEIIQKEQQKNRCNRFNKESLEALIDIQCFQSIPILFTLKLIKIK